MHDTAALQSVRFHDVESGCYDADIDTWQAVEQRAPKGLALELGAGTGRLTLAFARTGRTVVATDIDELLLHRLRERARGLPVSTQVADASSFMLPDRFALIVAGANLLNLLDRHAQATLIECAARHLAPSGIFAFAVMPHLSDTTWRWPLIRPWPLPDLGQTGPLRLISLPYRRARAGTDSYRLSRLRVQVGGGRVRASRDHLIFHRVDVPSLIARASEHGLVVAWRETIPDEDGVTPGGDLVAFARANDDWPTA